MGAALGALVTILLSAAAPAAEDPYASVPPCDPNTPSGLALFVPDSLPTGYRGGFYVLRQGRNNPDGSHWVGHTFGPVTVEPAAGGPLRFAYVDPAFSRQDQLYLRWPLRFAPGDGPARVSARYLEHRNGKQCARTISGVTQHEPLADPRLKYATRRLPNQRTRDRFGNFELRARVRVTGTVRKSAKRSILLTLFEGKYVRDRERVLPRDGRFAATLVFRARREAIGALRVKGAYPGDVKETWPCDDFVSSGVTDDCTTQHTDPRGLN